MHRAPVSHYVLFWHHFLSLSLFFFKYVCILMKFVVEWNKFTFVSAIVCSHWNLHWISLSGPKCRQTPGVGNGNLFIFSKTQQKVYSWVSKKQKQKRKPNWNGLTKLQCTLDRQGHQEETTTQQIEGSATQVRTIRAVNETQVMKSWRENRNRK